MGIAAEGGATPPTVPDAAARVLEFTQVARPEDVPLILKALSTTELNAGIVRLGLRLPEAVIDHVVAHGPPAARTTLAWQSRLPPSRPAAVRRTSLARGYDEDRVRDHAAVVREQNAARGHDTARRRLLSRAEPDLDRALFGRPDQVGIAWVRSAILRDRVGPDGEPIVPRRLRAELADFLSTAVLPISPEHLADTDTGDPEFELLRVLAGARDHGLSLPAARVLGLPGPIPARPPGWRDQVWVRRWDRPGAGSRAWRLDWDEVLALAADHDAVAGARGRFLGQVAGLDEAAAREDIPDDVRHRLLAGYPQAAWHAGAPTVDTLRRVAAAVAALEPRWGDFAKEPEFGTAIRDLIIRGLALGSLTAKEVIEHAVPGSVVLDLAWRSGEAILPAARGRADLAEELRARLADRIGDDVPLWGALLLRSLVWSGTVAELIDSTADLGAEPAFPSGDGLEEFDEPAREVRTVNVLLAFAGREVGLAALADEPGELSPCQLALLDRRPLAPGLVDRALAGDSGFDARRVPAGNPVTPREKSGTSWAQITHFVKNLGEARVYQLVAAAPSAERVHFLLKKFGPYLGPDTTALLYALLAEQAGPEPVWDLATRAAGGIEEVNPSLRASIAGGDAGPLLMAAESVAYQEIAGVTVPDPDQCYDPHPDDPARWPLENAVRQHLDNRPHRWRIMVRRLMEAGPLEYAQLVDLVQTVGGAGEPSEGEP